MPSTSRMTQETATTKQRAGAPAGLRLGERLRQLRVSAGLTQTDLAGDRFSKEYVSQIERGKTRPTREAIEEFEGIHSSVAATGLPELEVRALSGEATARMREGDVRTAIELLTRARHLTERPEFSDLERADVLFRLGMARYKLSSIQTAMNLFDEALKLAERSELPSDHLRSNILAWRSRCYRRRRDLEAAREDVERALELAEGLNDRRTTADIFFQAS